MLKFLIHRSSGFIFWAVFVGLVGGGSGAAILALVNQSLMSDHPASGWQVITYLGVAAVGVGAAVSSNIFPGETGPDGRL